MKRKRIQRPTVAGIDPGLSGALAIIHDTGRLNLFDFPVLSVGKSKMIDAGVLSDNLSADVQHIIIEHQQAMGQEARSSLAKLMLTFGQIVGLVQTRGFAHTIVPPAQWKRAYGLIGKDKAASHAIALRLYPSARKDLYGPRGGALTDRAEALLLAHWYFIGAQSM